MPARTRPTALPRPPNVFAGPYLDRVAHLRKDDAWLRETLTGPDARVVPVWQSKSLLRRTATGELAAAFVAWSRIGTAGEPVLLGQFDGKTYFALEVEAAEAALAAAEDEGAQFEELRLAGSLLDAQHAGVLAYARAMLYWQQRHRYCGVCGWATQRASAGHVMRCTNAACATDHFPRLDPAIIVLVSDGERALLGRQASWPPGRYSTIAGFVEPGESLEDAVAREVLEETSVRIDAAQYHSSQPWPFPSSLMIGYTAVADGSQVPRCDEELEDARWFTRAEIASGFPGLPPPQSVSFRLIEDWYDAGSPVRLRDTPGLKVWGSGRR